MIEEITIRDLGVISDAKLSFGPGLNVLTGETGAGKTMVLTALGLLLGERSDSSAIRQGQDQAFVEGRWLLPASHSVSEQVEALGGLVDAGELIVNRSVARDGRNRSAVGGAASPVAALAGLGEKLVVVHGQADQIRLKSATAQREALDQYAGIGRLVASYRERFENWKALEAKLSQLRSDSATREQELEQLRSAYAELEQLKPEAGEDAALAERAQKLTHSEELRIAAATAHEQLSSEGFDDAPDAQALLGRARKALEAVSAHDPELAALAEQLHELGFQLGELAANLSGYLASMESTSASELETVQARRAALNSAIRKYGADLDEVVAFHSSLSERILELDNSDEHIVRLEGERDAAFASMSELAGQISIERTRAAEKLAAEVSVELSSLAMGGASLVVSVTEASEFQAHGKDQVSIQLAAYPGAEPRPLGKGASGGELSRIMLAIEVVLAKTEQALTFIFDEVDAGVGGASATEVGLRLAQLAKNAQVIVVTHLGQVAAFANHHLRVLKTVGEQFTASDVVSLQGESRVEEVARMISGLSDSQNAQANARELITRANELLNR